MRGFLLPDNDLFRLHNPARPFINRRLEASGPACKGMPGPFRRRPHRHTYPKAAVQKRETEMPKLKSKSGAKKRFRTTATGKVRSNFAKKRHNLRKRTQKMKRNSRGTQIMADADARIVKSYLPYAK